MILDTIARSAGKRVEQRKQVKPLEQVMKEAFKCREREGCNFSYRIQIKATSNPYNSLNPLTWSESP